MSDRQAPLGAVAYETDPARAAQLRATALLCGVALGVHATLEGLHSSGAPAGSSFMLFSCAEPAEPLLDALARTVRDHPRVPVAALLPHDADPAWKERVLRSGVSDFLLFPCSVDELRLRIRSLARQAPPAPGYEDEIRTAISEVMIREHETLHVLGKAAEFKDQETGNHVLRVAQYSTLIARVVGVDQNGQMTIYHSSALHDVGKIGIPDSILLKPARLSQPEFRTIQTHTTNGHGILGDAASTYLLTGALIALTHHERFDGAGYPMGIGGEEIPLFGRIVCVADVFDALTTRRPYKEPWTMDRAFELLRSERGRQFDPTMVDAFCANQRAVEQIHRDADRGRAPGQA
jgi:response regulator RpfG family c-di-GMP phosphodiesterase